MYKKNFDKDKAGILVITLVTFFLFAMVISTTTIKSDPIPDEDNPLGDRSITWDKRMNFSETGGTTDYVKFGEAPDARDGPPADTYDVAKPPAPMTPYIRAYLNDNLPTPFDKLWSDYRQYPDTQKTWNLSVQWYPTG